MPFGKASWYIRIGNANMHRFVRVEMAFIRSVKMSSEDGLLIAASAVIITESEDKYCERRNDDFGRIQVFKAEHDI